MKLWFGEGDYKSSSSPFLPFTGQGNKSFSHSMLLKSVQPEEPAPGSP